MIPGRLLEKLSEKVDDLKLDSDNNNADYPEPKSFNDESSSDEGGRGRWICGGSVLRLENRPENERKMLDSIRINWNAAQPVVISKVEFSEELWSPEKHFKQQFSQIKAKLVDVSRDDCFDREANLDSFWEGFSDVEKRDSKDKALKIAGWPPVGDEFEENLPLHHSDLLAGLPLQIYTSNAGSLNLAANLPDVFVKNSLGPRAEFVQGLGYESALKGGKGSGKLRMHGTDTVAVITNFAAVEGYAINTVPQSLDLTNGLRQCTLIP